MHKMARFALGAVIAVIIATAGIAAGYVLHDLQQKRLFSQDDAGPVKEATIVQTVPAAPRPYNHTTYKISPPSRGAAIQKITVTLTPTNTGADAFTAIADATEARNVKTGQTVMFLNTDGLRISALGTVSQITPSGVGDEAKITISISISSGKIGDAGAITTAEIVTDRRTDAERLPLSAVVMKNGEPYLWEVARNDDGTNSAYIKRTNLLATCGEMAVVQTPSAASNIFVLQPDSALSDGDKINTSTEFYSGEEYTEEQIVASEIETRYPTPPGPDPYTGPDFPSACDVALSGTKPQSASTAEDFIAKIRTLSSPAEAQNTGSIRNTP